MSNPKGATEILKEYGQFHLELHKKIRADDVRSVVSNGLCFWDTEFALHAMHMGTAWPQKYPDRVPLLKQFIQEWGLDRVSELEDGDNAPDISRLRVLAQSAMDALNRGEGLSREHWPSDWHFALITPHVRKALWLKRSGEGIFSLSHTPHSKKATPTHSYAGLLSATDATTQYGIQENQHFQVSHVRLPETILNKLLSKIVAQLLKQVNV